MSEFRRLSVRDCQGTLWAFYRRYVGQAIASFEGDLSGLRLDELAGASSRETNFLQRQTTQPVLDFITVPINEGTLGTLKARLASRGVLGRHGRILHTQLTDGSNLLLSACDNFHDDCTVVSSAVPESFLKDLQDHGLLRRAHRPSR